MQNSPLLDIMQKWERLKNSINASVNLIYKTKTLIYERINVYLSLYYTEYIYK
jgi:hypothetical protein